MKLTLGFSPCPNDTFMFDAMIHHKIDTEGLEFDVCMEDVETLNNMAFEGKADLTKLSYHAYAFVADRYVLLDAGSALGFGCGPLLISKHDIDITKNESLRVGIPGKYTTANFLLSIAFPHLLNKKEMIFSEIEQALIDEKIDLGLIIHENRFTYLSKGLKKIIDLGSYWEELTGLPIPLGGIVASRKLPEEVIAKANRVLRRSIEFAFEYPASSMSFVKAHSQEMEEDVMKKHIELYVNTFSLELGTEGRNAVQQLFKLAKSHHLIPDFTLPLFLKKASSSTL